MVCCNISFYLYSSFELLKCSEENEDKLKFFKFRSVTYTSVASNIRVFQLKDVILLISEQ